MSKATTFSLTINLGDNVYKTLKDGGYSLCVCKKVGDVYDVIWSGADFQHLENLFQWTESYAVFGSTQFTSGTYVKGATKTQDIGFNQTCLLDKQYCDMEPATGSIDPTIGYFTVDNECVSNNMHIGVKQYLGSGTAADPAQALPIFVSKNVVTGTIQLTPLISLLLFFDTELKTSMIFETAVSKSTEVVYKPGTTSITCLYNDNQQWEIEGKVQPKLGYHSSRGFFKEAAADHHKEEGPNHKPCKCT